MKLQGGYQPRIPGRPAADVREVAAPGRLEISLVQRGLRYSPAVTDGAQVAFGAPLAWAEAAGGRLALPAPAAGRAYLVPGGKGGQPRVSLDVSDAAARAAAGFRPPSGPRAACEALAAAGLWPLLYSSKTGGLPRLDGSEAPARLIVSFVATEPFRASPSALLGGTRERLAAGLRALRRLLPEGGLIHLAADGARGPAAQALQALAAGDARVRVETVPARYPAEHPRVLARALRRQDGSLKADDAVWVLDAQAALAAGDCLESGLPLHARVVALGGPGFAAPLHVRARLGTPLEALLAPASPAGGPLVLRGGLFQGEPAQPGATLEASDDALFAMPRRGEREYLGFVCAGFDRASVLPCFGSALTGAPDRTLTATLRGEVRPCVACGQCEDRCPMGLMPQVLHRFLYRDALDEAVEAGLALCIGCGLCSFVCVSKLELRHQFAQAQERLRLEREQLEADAQTQQHGGAR